MSTKSIGERSHPCPSERKLLSRVKHVYIPIATLVTMSAGLLLSGCKDGSSTAVFGTEPDDDFCNVDISFFADGGVGKDGIPALTDPPLVSAAAVDYLDPADRIIGFVTNGQPIAVPHNILWYHEIANFNFAESKIAVTYCPLTGSSIGFDRSVAGGAEFGVSGLLFKNNLTMYDRRSSESLWPQMSLEASCGQAQGTEIPLVAVFEMTWSGWKDLHPDTQAISDELGRFDPRLYQEYPYRSFDYEDLDNGFLLFPQGPLDTRRPPKERVLGIARGSEGKAFPFGELDLEALRAVNDVVAGAPVVVFWDRSRSGAAAFDPIVGGRTLTFAADGDQFVDAETGTSWSMRGEAILGPLTGTRLEPIPEAYVAFWFAWASFQPDTDLWLGS